MKTYRVALVVVASTAILSGCAVDTVTYSPGYASTVYTSDYGAYPSYYWGYQNDYSPVYAVDAYSGWGRGYYGGWGGGYRGGWAGGYRGGWGGGHHGGWGGHHGGRR